MSITAITPTGDRSLAFNLLQQWVKNQTVTVDQWLVIDDGKTPMEGKIPMEVEGVEYIRREPLASDPEHTLGLNLQACVERIKGDYIFIMEDDEYYAPTYIEEMLRRLQRYEVVGIGCSKYYNLPMSKWWRDRNMSQASLAQTAFRKSFVPKFSDCINGDFYIDVRLWESVNGAGYMFDDGDQMLYVGMKGLPGRKGIGIGHSNNSLYQSDTDGSVLKKWCPKDYQHYIDINRRGN